MTKVSKGIAKSILMIMLLIFSVWACSNENVLSSVQQAISNGGTDIYDFDDGRSGDGIAAVLLKFDGADYGAELYEVTAVCLSDKKVGTYQNYTEGWLTVFELPVGKYKFTVVGKDKAKVNTYCVGTVTLTLDDEVDMTAFVSLVYADNSTQIEYSSSSSDGFLFEFVDTLCVGETKNVQLTTADNWFGFISSASQTLYLSWMTKVSIQNVLVYKDGRGENNIVCGNISDENFNATQYTIEAESGEHYYYIRVIATQATNECQLSLTDSAAQVPTSTTTTIPPVVTTTSTSTTSSTSTSIAPTPTVKTEKPVISYSATNSKATIVCPQSNASIYYTTNNGNPSVRYTGAITASVGTTIKAMAKAPGYLDSDIVSYTISPTVTINVDFEEDFSGIRVLVAKSLNFPKIYYWDASDANAYPKPSWPGVDMLSYDDKDYCYEFKGCTSVKLLITNASKAKLCGTYMEITSAGEYRVTSAGCT
ncbi:MAG: starch-binding protein, partial [Spirochaetales bacterium]|nr:starch-binding protein [Spirochaetales bacterium]